MMSPITERVLSFGLHRLWTTVLVLVLQAAIASAWAGEAPRRGGTLRLARISDLQSMDPAICYDGEGLLLERLVFQGLLDFDDQTRLYAKQASSWSISADRKTYTFQLRPGVRFANGREVDATDYVYSLQRVLDLRTQSPGEGFFNRITGAADFQKGTTPSIKGLRARDRLTLEIELEEPDFTFEFKMTMTFACPVPREGLERTGNQFWRNAFGTGPYRITDWIRGVRLEMERSAYVNQQNEGCFDRVSIMLGGDRALQAMMLERGELDFVYLAQIPDIVRMSRDTRWRSSVVAIEAAETDMLYLNTELVPFNNPAVRQAVCHAIDRNRLATLTAHTAIAARSILPPLMLGFNAAQEGLAFDPEKAKRLLHQAGYEEGPGFELLYSDGDPRWERIVAAIESDLRKVGFKVTLHKLTFPALLTSMQTRKSAQCAYCGWTQDYPDPGNFLDSLFNGSKIQEFGGNNYSYYNNPVVNQLLELAGKSGHAGERYALYQRIETVILQDSPAVPLVHSATPVLVSPSLGGFKPHPVWGLQFERWWKND